MSTDATPDDGCLMHGFTLAARICVYHSQSAFIRGFRTIPAVRPADAPHGEEQLEL